MESNFSLKVARLRSGLTQARLAHEIGVTENKVCRYETGRAIPTEKIQDQIAHVLNTSKAQLFPAKGGE